MSKKANKVSALEKALRAELCDKPQFNEITFQRMLKAFVNRDKIKAIQEARVILGLGVLRAIEFVMRYW